MAKMCLGVLPELTPEEKFPDSREPEETKVMQDVKDGEDCKDDEPEPEKDINLLVENVDGKDTLGIMSLDITTGTVLVEGALGHPGKHPGHGVRSLLLLQLRHGDDVTAVGGELSPQEVVHEEQLPDNVEKVEKLAEEES